MYNLPPTIFWPKDARHLQRQGRDLAPTANLGPEPLYFYKVCQLRRHTLRYVLEAGSVAVSVIRCRLLHRLGDLLPSTRERAKGIAQGYIVSLGIELLRRRRVSFHELTQSEVVFFHHLIEVFGV